MERAQTGKDTSSDPGRKLPFHSVAGSVDADLEAWKSLCKAVVDTIGESLNQTWSAGDDNVVCQISSNIHVARIYRIDNHIRHSSSGERTSDSIKCKADCAVLCLFPLSAIVLASFIIRHLCILVVLFRTFWSLAIQWILFWSEPMALQLDIVPNQTHNSIGQGIQIYD